MCRDPVYDDAIAGGRASYESFAIAVSSDDELQGA